jgi:hypothetical protein
MKKTDAPAPERIDDSAGWRLSFVCRQVRAPFLNRRTEAVPFGSGDRLGNGAQGSVSGPGIFEAIVQDLHLVRIKGQAPL